MCGNDLTSEADKRPMPARSVDPGSPASRPARPGARTPRPTSHSRSISEDTFVQSNMRKTMKLGKNNVILTDVNGSECFL